jgi:hypothetical protein
MITSFGTGQGPVRVKEPVSWCFVAPGVAAQPQSL